MFTGIIQETAKIKSIKEQPDGTVFTLETKNILKDKKLGDSIATNGVCITIIELTPPTFKFVASPETMNVSTFQYLKEGDIVNLEGAMKLGDTLDGHMVQGHVDAQGTVTALTQKDSKITLTIEFPKSISQYLAFKGSITVDGVSLTISDLQNHTFSVELIPYTMEETNLKTLKKSDKVNLETDMIARYLDRLLNDREKQTKYEYLKERGFI